MKQTINKHTVTGEDMIKSLGLLKPKITLRLILNKLSKATLIVMYLVTIGLLVYQAIK